MSNKVRYLVTVDEATGATIKVERLGDAGDLTEIPLSTFVAPPAAAPAAPSSVVVNVYLGGAAGGPPVVHTHAVGGAIGPSPQGQSGASAIGPSASPSAIGPSASPSAIGPHMHGPAAIGPHMHGDTAAAIGPHMHDSVTGTAIGPSPAGEGAAATKKPRGKKPA